MFVIGLILTLWVIAVGLWVAALLVYGYRFSQAQWRLRQLLMTTDHQAPQRLAQRRLSIKDRQRLQKYLVLKTAEVLLFFVMPWLAIIDDDIRWFNLIIALIMVSWWWRLNLFPKGVVRLSRPTFLRYQAAGDDHLNLNQNPTWQRLVKQSRHAQFRLIFLIGGMAVINFVFSFL
ncbi:hypothetical protein [Lactiplantibacillus fabifermentans]|uniref:Integral membrane protein n=2 Tax=Lactiplantibacillus fabifermentans TaxID=483011 RepID=A0A0R2NA28_9LACO|nr:hypothetical protein [Lactiplantibacillus fabifermentans]ETY72728.1 hypothetical protein LFAB_16065 [Lactiplantibacillus fabifermentans T30PCM01]KRO22734.1 hypothetical protein DY78_GL001921 [Lactiplantibacillus fabifermentans DSM 21115]